MLSSRQKSPDPCKRFKISGHIPRKTYLMQSWLLESNSSDKIKLNPSHREILISLKFSSLNQISRRKKCLMHPRLQVRFHCGFELSLTHMELCSSLSQRNCSLTRQSKSWRKLKKIWLKRSKLWQKCCSYSENWRNNIKTQKIMKSNWKSKWDCVKLSLIEQKNWLKDWAVRK